MWAEFLFLAGIFKNNNMAEFVTCSQDSVVFWDYKSFSSKRSAQPFGGSGYHVSSACWNTNNNKLMVAPKWGDSIAWCEPATDASNWNTVWHKDGGHFTCGCLMSSSRYLLSGASDGLLMLWDIKNKSSTKTFEAHTSPVTGVVSSYNDQLVLSGAQDGTLLLHSLSSSHLLKHTVTLSHTDTTSQGAITRLRFSVMDHAMAASASEKGCVCLWSVESQRMLHEFSFSSGTTTDLCFAQSNNKLLVSVGQDCKIHFLDTQQRKEVMVVSTMSPLMSVAILRDGYTVAAGGVDGKMYVYELRSIKSPKHVIEAHQGAVTCIAEQNLGKPSRGSGRKSSSHSSKKSAKESARQGVLTPSDTLAPTGASGVVEHSRLTQHDSTSSAVGSIISPLVHTSDAPPERPSQAPSLPVVFQVPTRGGSAASGVPQQTPIAAPRAASSLQWAQFTTPAQPASDKDSTGIFSPIDSTLSTPHPSGSGGKATAAIPPTQRPQPSATAQDTRGYPLMSTFVSSTPAMQQPPLGMSGIFSPLDAATPSSLGTTGSHTVGGWPGPQCVPSATSSAATPALDRVSVQSPPNINAGQLGGDFPSTATHIPPSSSTTTTTSLYTPHTLPTSTTTTSLYTPHTLPTSSITTAATTSASHSSLSMTDSNTCLQPQLPQPHHARHHLTTGPPDSVEGFRTTPPKSEAEVSQTATQQANLSLDTVTLLPHARNIQLQYMEKLIRDSNEELRYATHRDIRALGLDMFRQFLVLQQQFGRAVSTLNEKIERLSEENKQLQEQLHQYMPKY